MVANPDPTGDGSAVGTKVLLDTLLREGLLPLVSNNDWVGLVGDVDPEILGEVSPELLVIGPNDVPLTRVGDLTPPDTIPGRAVIGPNWIVAALGGSDRVEAGNGNKGVEVARPGPTAVRLIFISVLC